MTNTSELSSTQTAVYKADSTGTRMVCQHWAKAYEREKHETDKQASYTFYTRRRTPSESLSRPSRIVEPQSGLKTGVQNRTGTKIEHSLGNLGEESGPNSSIVIPL